MTSRSAKWLILASALLLALPVVAGASTSRIAGMGMLGDYVKDYTNIFGYPSCVANVGNLVYGEFGQVTDYDENYSEYFNTEDRAVGAVLGNLWDGRYGTFAFHMREYSPALGQGFQPYVSDVGYNDEYIFGTGFETFNFPNFDPNIPGQTDYTPFFNSMYGVEAMDLMWAKKFQKLSFGLRFNRSFYKFTQDAPDQTYEGYEPDDRNVIGFGGGLGYDFSDKMMGELGVLYQSRTFKWQNPAGDVFENDGSGAYLISGRLLWQWQPNVMVVPVFRYYSFDMGSKETPSGGTTLTDKDKISGWQVGFAGNWTLNQNDLFVAGLSFASNTYDYKHEINNTNEAKFTESLMPVMFAALETHVNPWLTVRFGGRKGVFYSLKHAYTLPTAYETKESWSPFQFFMGAGVKLGTLQLDGTLAQDFFHNPATYFTGSPNGQNYYSPLFPKVTATYSF